MKIAKELQKQLSSDGIKVILTRDNDDVYPTKDDVKKLATENKVDILVDFDINNTNQKDIFGVKVYYGTAESAIIARSIEKNLSENYISKVSSSEKQGNFD